MQKNNKLPLADVFRKNPKRGARYRTNAGGWVLDLAGLPLSDETFAALDVDFQGSAIAHAVQRLFAGDIVNPTEGRPALHMALRADNPGDFPGADPDRCLLTQRDAWLGQAARWFDGSSGLTDIIHVGIGGSDLGPRLVADALDDARSAVRVHWQSTLDSRRLARLLATLNPATTGLVVASKSMRTEESLAQAQAVMSWLGDAAADRCWAATASPGAAIELGLRAEHVLPFPEWTGGRFSLWSSVGVSAAAAIGPDAFRALLAGAARADADVCQSAPAAMLARRLALLVHALPACLGLTDLTVVAYEPRLRLLGAFLQQLFMESLGKRVDLAGQPVHNARVPLFAGGVGTDFQHSIFQALHQGLDDHPLLLVGSLDDAEAWPDWQRRQLAHLLAQTTAFVRGASHAETWRQAPGERPVALLMTDSLTAGNLGYLLASFEHAVYLLSMLWEVNAFDQWGVEEGKRLAGDFHQALADIKSLDALFALLDRRRAGD
ncbi:MAG: hypothetical protein ACXIUB_11365 [Wenzhouxiangella sp.]